MILPKLPATPTCSIIIPCWNEEEHIGAVVEQARTQRYPADLVEILVVDGGSSDATRAIVGSIAARDPRVQLLHNPARLQAAGMNEGIRRSRGDVIVRMDAHADYAADYVAASVRELQRTGAANVGGAARPRANNAFQRALCAALESPLGVGGSAYRSAEKEGFVESVFNGAFRREALEIAGLYDPRARTNEDAELNQRIIEAGGKVFLSREVVVFYYPRSSLGALARQYFRYGEGRAQTLLKRGRLLSLRPFIPCAAVTTAGVLLGLGAIAPSALALLASLALAYGALTAFEAIRRARRHRELGMALTLLAIFPTMHLLHGLGVWKGLVVGLASGIQDAEPDRLLAR
jgi:succinoglycan biosynthesis protein ExoA